MLKGNKGEWSELYVLIKLIADGKLYQSDSYLNKDQNNVYDVVQAIKEESRYDLIFKRDDQIIVNKISDGTVSQLALKTPAEFQSLALSLLHGIKNGRGKSFSIDSLEDDLTKLAVKTVKARSDSKADIKLRIYDHRLAKEADLGFSIKSLLGSDSTLFNPNDKTNFIYEIDNFACPDLNSFNASTYAPAGNVSKITHRVESIFSAGGNFRFVEIQSKQLWKNLKMIDGDMPAIVGYALLYRWLYRKSDLKEVTGLLEEKDPLNFYDGEESEQKLYEYKIKKFLVESAMGMTSEAVWHGEYDSFGGVIIAKNDGDVVCFHIYDFNLFRNYLLNNTKFEQPATGEDEDNPGFPRIGGKKYYYGWLYTEDDRQKFKINLQIRFK